MRIAYLDESGTPEPTGGTSHFVLLALSINAQTWKEKDRDVGAIKATFGLGQAEIHAAWMARRYLEQEAIAGFAAMDRDQRRAEVKKVREYALVRKAVLVRRFHREGTRWTTRIPYLVETPLFVDSRLTSLVQVADLCAYAFRRYVENGETDLFDRVFPKVDEASGRRVGARHYRDGKACSCRICQKH